MEVPTYHLQPDRPWLKDHIKRLINLKNEIFKK